MLEKSDRDPVRYSAVIRSLGTKVYLDATLAGLRNQSLAPAEILIVLPEGSPTPQLDDASHVRFEHRTKGPVKQRIAGIQLAANRYQLLLDDDMVFENADSVERLFNTMRVHNAVCVIPRVDLPAGWSRIPVALLGIAIPWRRMELRIMAGGGFRYPAQDPGEQLIEIEGGRGVCVAVDAEFLREKQVFGDVDFETCSYAQFDDGAFIFEMVLNGGRALMVDAGGITHVGESHRFTTRRLEETALASVLNTYIFWKKYVRRKHRGPIWPRIALVWRLAGSTVVGLMTAARRLSPAPIVGLVKGYNRILLHNWGRGR